MLISSPGVRADMQVAQFQLRALKGARFAAFAEAELLIGGVSVILRGLRVLTAQERLAMPQYRDIDGRWRTALALPAEVMSALEDGLTRYWAGETPSVDIPESDNDIAMVTCTIRDLRPQPHARVLAEATVEIGIAGYQLTIAGVQLVYTVKHGKDQKATLRFPHYKAVDGSWQPVIRLPAEMLTPLWQLFLDTCVEAGVLNEHQLEYSEESAA